MTPAERELEKLQKQMDVLKETIKNENSKVPLKLVVDTITGSLDFMYGDILIGMIDNRGKMFMLKTPESIEAWEKWYNSSMIVDQTYVKWKNKEYRIGSGYILETNHDQYIYDFECAQVFSDCEDDNIQRLSNGVPILF